MYYCNANIQTSKFLIVHFFLLVALAQGESFGAVKVWNDNNYGLVCSEGFTDVAATVVCNELGYGYGVSLCCSAFGHLRIHMARTAIQCTGNEERFSDCSSDVVLSRCPGLKYASVVCSARAPPIGITHFVIYVVQHQFVRTKYGLNMCILCAAITS
jgi:hypothetical protein